MNIIVIRYRNPEVEDRCLESVEKFTDLSKHTLTVFDNAPENINLGKLWNQLIEASDQEVICLLNSDTVVEEGWTRMEESLADPLVGAVGPVTDNCGTIQKGLSRSESIEKTGDLSGFCYLFTKTNWRKVGRFPESFPFYGQESMFNRKLQYYGLNLVIDRRVFIHHDKGASYKKAVENGEMTDEETWGAFHYWNYLSRRDILKNVVSTDFKIIIIGGGRGNPFPLHRGLEQACDDFFGENALLLNAGNVNLKTIIGFDPDLIINTDTNDNENVMDTLFGAKLLGIKTALYFNDLRCPIHNKYSADPGLMRDLHKVYDAIFLCNEEHRECWEKIGKVNVFYMPQGSIQHPRPPKGNNYHILHIGSEFGGTYHTYRKEVIDKIRETQAVETKNSPEREKRIKIQNDSYGDYHSSDFSIAISMDAEKYTSDRLYTILGSGGCALAFKARRLDEIFDSSHLLWFDTPEDALRKLETESKQRNGIKQNAFKHVQKHHLYSNRLLNILQNIYTEDKTFHGDLNNLYIIGK